MKNFKLKFNEDLCKCLVCKKKNFRLMQLGSKTIEKCVNAWDWLKAWKILQTNHACKILNIYLQLNMMIMCNRKIPMAVKQKPKLILIKFIYMEKYI